MADQKQPKSINNLADTNVDITPVGYTWNIRGSEVEEYLYNYFSDIKQITGITNVRVRIIREGSSPQLAVYVSLDRKSVELVSNRNLDKRIERKLDAVSYKASQKLLDAFKPFFDPMNRDDKFKLIISDGKIFVRCNPFMVLGHMLAADPRFHRIFITEVVRKKRESIISVTKTLKPSKSGADDEIEYDDYDRIIDRLERR